MTLLDLCAEFVTVTDEWGSYRRVKEIAVAQGVSLKCPRCFVDKGNTIIGVHMILCWSRSRGVADDIRPGPGRWALDGTSLSDLTLNADPPNTLRSVQIEGDCRAHFNVTNGEVTFC